MSSIKLTFSCGNIDNVYYVRSIYYLWWKSGPELFFVKEQRKFLTCSFRKTAVFGRIYIHINSDEIERTDDNRQVTLVVATITQLCML